ncbi:MAG TPA: flagellar filament capping protein FliD [Spirochaetota bacterium]|nr:flagellar filament capping protein FliD [Spirochaetota bacterium]
MPVTLGGVASGMDTDQIIQKLVEVEARPIIQWQEEKDTYSRRKEALRQLQTKLNTLNNATKDLYGFRSPFREKGVQVSDTSVLQAQASRYAVNGTHTLEVLNLASTHKVSTDQIKEDEILPAGTFSIEVDGNSYTIKFRGGNLRTLSDKVNEIASSIVSAATIKTIDDKSILTIESKVPGKKGEIKIRGDEEYLKKIGLVKGEKGAAKESQRIIFDTKYFTGYTGDKPVEDEDGTLTVDKDGKKITIDAKLWREYILPVEYKAQKQSILELNVTYSKEKSEEEVIPYKIEIGPEETTVIKGIELKGYNISRERPLEKKPKKEVEDIIGVGVVSVEDGKRTEKIYKLDHNKQGKQEIPIGQDFADKKITKILFYCNDGKATFQDASLVTEIKGEGILDPKNVIAEANDARIKLDGVEIVRSKNNGIDDVLKGVTFNLLSTSTKPVTITIRQNTETAVEKIKKFVEAYNDYLTFNNELTKAVKSDKVGDYQKDKNKNGIFMGDMTLLRLQNALKTAISSAYPSNVEKPIKMLYQIGVSTGEINAKWETIREGKLIIDEAKLVEVLSENPEGVQNFFGSDNDGDNRIDNGLAFKIESILDPYVSAGKNIIVAKMDLEDASIKATDERIERKQEHLKAYEQKLRQKFAAMEKAISGSKSQSSWLDMQMKNLQKQTEK